MDRKNGTTRIEKDPVCPKGNNCCPQLTLYDSNGGFICGGRNKEPHKYRLDKVKLCLHNRYVKNFGLELTNKEAVYVARALLNAVP